MENKLKQYRIYNNLKGEYEVIDESEISDRLKYFPVQVVEEILQDTEEPIKKEDYSCTQCGFADVHSPDCEEKITIGGWEIDKKLNCPKELSDCCKAELEIHQADEGTGHFRCKSCGKACDPYEKPNLIDLLEREQQDNWEDEEYVNDIGKVVYKLYKRLDKEPTKHIKIDKELFKDLNYEVKVKPMCNECYFEIQNGHSQACSKYEKPKNPEEPTEDSLEEKIHEVLGIINNQYFKALREKRDGEANGYAHSVAIIKLLLKGKE